MAKMNPKKQRARRAQQRDAGDATKLEQARALLRAAQSEAETSGFEHSRAGREPARADADEERLAALVHELARPVQWV